MFATELKRWLLEQLSADGGSAEDAERLDAALQRLTSQVLGEEETARPMVLQDA